MAETYWDRRQRMADEALDRDEAAIARRAAKAYEAELAKLEREIASYYTRWGVDGVVGYRTMLLSMDPRDRDLLMRDCEEFQRLHPDLARYVEIRKGVYRLDRLEGLQASARLHLARATERATGDLDGHFGKAAAKAANAVRDTMGFGTSFYGYDDDVIRRLVGARWVDGQSYSERIWGSADRLAAYVANDLAIAFARGDSYERIARDLRHRFKDVSLSNVMRLVQTEGTYVAREAQAAELERAGMDEYEIRTAGDGRVCPSCVGAARQTYRLADRRPGQNFPPLHPRCRCVVDPAVADWDAWLDRQADRERAKLAARRFGVGESEALVKAGDGEANRYTVNYKVVNSREFHDKFDSLPYPKPVRDTLYRLAGRMLSDMDGTRGERLAAVDVRTGAIVADTFSRKPEESRAYFSDDERSAIERNPNKVVFLHNHPGGSDPSYDDIRSALTNPYMEGSVIAGHNGRVYLILPDKRKEAFARLVEWLQMSKELTSDKKEAEDMARQALLDENARRRWMQCVEMGAGPK